MKPYLRKIRWILIGDVFLHTINAILNALMLLFPGWLIDNYQRGLPYIGKLFVAYCVVFLCYLINAYFGNRIADYRRFFFERAIKKDFFDAVLRRDYQQFHQHDIGEYLSMQSNDITELCTNYLTPFCCVMESGVMILVFGISLIIFVNLYIALIIIFFSALIVFVPQLTADRVSKRNKCYLDQVGQYTATVKTLYEAHEILDCNSRKQIMSLHERELNQVMKRFMGFRKLNSFAMVLNGGSVEFIYLLAFAAIALMLIRGSITLGMATIAFSYSTKFADPIYLLNTQLGTLNSVKKIKEKILKIICEKTPEVESVPDVREISTTALKKHYENTEICLPATQMNYPNKYLIVGENGAGKSVFFRLLMQFEVADAGQVRFNGCEVHSGIAERICYVPQQPVVFQASYEENITVFGTYSAEKLPQYEAYFPQSVLSQIKRNPDPKTLSGGEKQVIAILRALCSEKPIILLDEPFAAMNQLTMESFLKQMAQIDRMLVIIAHNVDEYAGQFHECIRIQRCI